MVAPEGDPDIPTDAEMMFLKHEIAVYEELGENKLTDRPLQIVFKFTDQSTADIYHDYFYKRLMVDILMARTFPDYQKWPE